jgi:hypothetical protein
MLFKTREFRAQQLPGLGHGPFEAMNAMARLAF